MNVSILTLFPELYKEFLQTSLLKRAQDKNLVKFSTHSLFEYVKVKQRIDAPTFGHSSGMLLKPEIIEKAIADVDARHGKSFKIIMSPQGRKLDQQYSKQLWDKIKSYSHITMLASRYEGIDARVEQHYADEIVSVGDFVVMGGDVPAMLLIECLFRHMPEVVGKEESVLLDSFTGAFVDHPEYTKPVVWKGVEVPEVLRSGNHAAIEQWRKEKAAELTVKKHFDWLRSRQVTEQEVDLVKKYIPSHYVALMHSDMLLKGGKVGNTSVTSLDIHDIARSAATYGMKDLYVVTPLKDQQRIIQTLLDFWQEEKVGGEYNKDRFEALSRVKLEGALQQVIDDIESKEGQKPIVVGTSACNHKNREMLTYYQQELVWKHNKPVLFLLGTGHGMSDKLLDQCDYMLQPLKGFSDFNHLSVRSAAAIIFDKWLGMSLRT